MKVMVEVDFKKMAVLLSAMEDLRETVEVYEENHGTMNVARTPIEMTTKKTGAETPLFSCL